MKKAVFMEIPFNRYTPIEVYQALADKGACILEPSIKTDRFSFIGIDPMVAISGKGDYSDALRKFMNENPIIADHPLALYTGGCIGYIGYDDAFFFQIYRSGAVFDHQRSKAVLFTIGENTELEQLHQKLKTGKLLPEPLMEIGPITVDKSDEEFIAMVEKAKEHLRAGDVFQIVLSRTFKAPMKGDSLEFYRILRNVSPAPYLFYFDFKDFAIAGASPEKIISVQGRDIESMPIAGTKPKGSPAADLLNDPKEIAEHVMLVDLARNDLGAVSEPGSVKVIEFQKIHEFSHVDHIISRVVGRLDSQYDALDAFKASFPAGTLTGAPKVRAMELIHEIEKSDRGLYGGAIIAIDTKGNLTSCIAIRTAILKDGNMFVRAGAGIVLDSDPLKEAAETYIKAKAVLEVANALNSR